MNNQQFFEKVAQMRQHQKTFFQARPSSQERKDALIASKRLETEIDQEIARVQAILAKKDIFLVQYKDVDGSIASSLVEGFPTVEPTIRRGNDGVSSWVDNLSISFGKWRQQSIKAYGNAWVPQVAYEIFRAIELITKQQTEQ